MDIAVLDPQDVLTELINDIISILPHYNKYSLFLWCTRKITTDYFELLFGHDISLDSEILEILGCKNLLSNQDFLGFGNLLYYDGYLEYYGIFEKQYRTRLIRFVWDTKKSLGSSILRLIHYVFITLYSKIEKFSGLKKIFEDYCVWVDRVLGANIEAFINKDAVKRILRPHVDDLIMDLIIRGKLKLEGAEAGYSVDYHWPDNYIDLSAGDKYLYIPAIIASNDGFACELIGVRKYDEEPFTFEEIELYEPLDNILAWLMPLVIIGILDIVPVLKPYSEIIPSHYRRRIEDLVLWFVIEYVWLV